MKKVMWIVSIIPFIITGIVLQFMPDSVPMHYDAAGTIDRWGSKYENLLFPVIILTLTFFWQLLIWFYEKKAKKATSDKESAEALSNVKMLYIVAISMAVMYCIMQCFILYGACVEANTNATHSAVDIAQVSCILMGALFIVLGNFMPKAKKNRTVGVRVVWSMHNDVTWMKSNRFGAVVLVIVGVLTIVTSVFVNSMLATGLLLVYLLLGTAIILIYSYKVYKVEVSKEKKREN